MAGRRREAMAWNARWKRCDGMEREGTMERTCRFFWDVSPRSGLFATSVLSQSAAPLAMGPVQSCCEASAISSSGVR